MSKEEGKEMRRREKRKGEERRERADSRGGFHTGEQPIRHTAGGQTKPSLGWLGREAIKYIVCVKLLMLAVQRCYNTGRWFCVCVCACVQKFQLGFPFNRLY